MTKKVKYTWELMHGDGDHYDKYNLTLCTENEIKFFDYVISLNFESYDCIGFNNINKKAKEKLLKLFKETIWYITSDLADDLYWVHDALRNLNYIDNDLTCEDHYARIQYVNRKELKEKKTNKFKVDREILIFAFRYALGRESFAPSIVTDNIKANIDNINTNDIKLYIKEINECNNYGMEMDKQHWLKFKNYLENILYKRK